MGYFLWSAALGAMVEIFCRRGFVTSCCLCKEEGESVNHIILLSFLPFSSGVLYSVSLELLGSSRPRFVKDLVQCLRGISQGRGGTWCHIVLCDPFGGNGMTDASGR